MNATFSIPDAFAYGDGEALPTSRPGGLDILDAIYHAAHGGPGGIAALAARMGMPVPTLTHKVNPNNTTHNVFPRELLALQELSGNAAPLHAMADRLGYTCTRATPDQSGGCPVDAFMRLQTAFAELVCAVADPLQPQGKEVSRNEMRRAERQAAELQAAIGHTLAALRGRMRVAPKVDY